MASSTLKLVIQKGPRSGETLEFTPNSTVRIGRVMRGNNLPIKDSGISSKHLTIEFDSDSEAWVITDLDSSNGTVVNSTQIKPLSPFEIFHEDEIKIGESTSIRVEIVEIREKIDDCRNPRNLGKVGSVENGEEIGNCRNPRTRGASRSGVDLGESVGIGGETDNRRNLRSRVSSKRGNDDCLNLEKKSVVRVMEENVEGKRRGRGRGRPPKKVSNLEDGKNVENVEVKPECGVSTRRTRSSKRKEDDLLSGVEVLPVRTRRKKNAEDVMKKIVESKCLDMDDCGEVFGSNVPETDVLNLEKGARSTKNTEDVMASSLMEKVVESKDLDMDGCKEVESISEVKNGKARGSCADCSEDVEDAIPEEKINQEKSEQEVPEKVVLIRGKVWARSTKDAEDLMASSVMEKVVESKGLDMDGCKEVESISEVKNGKAQGSRAECSENVQDAIPEEEINQEESEHIWGKVGARSMKNGEDATADLVMEGVVESKDLDMDCCKEVESISEVNNGKARGSHAECLKNVQDSVLAKEINQEESEQEVPEKVVDLKEQPCEESVDDALEKDVRCDMKKNQEFMEVEENDRDSVPEEVINHEADEDEDVIEKIVESKGLDLDNCKEVFGSKDPETTVVPDLEKMTLEDWFNYFEVYWPKQIYAARDAIIDDMRKRAIQYNDFMLQQQKEKSKLPLATELARS